MKRLGLLPFVAILFGWTGSTLGLFSPLKPVPIDRLLKSAEAYVAANPDSAEAHYTLARIHYLAFVRSSSEVPAMGEKQDFLDANGKPQIAADWMLLPGVTGSMDERASQLAKAELGTARPNPGRAPERFQKWKAVYDRHLSSLYMAEYRQQRHERWTNSEALTNQKAIAHVTAAVAGFREAIRLPREAPVTYEFVVTAPTHGLHELGLASLMEQFADWKQLRKPIGLSTELQEIDHAKAREAYLKAFRIAYPHDSALGSRPVEGFAALVSHESATAFIRLAEGDPQHLEAKTELAKTLAEMKAGLAKIRKLPRGAVTPILFSLQAREDIEELLAPEMVVDFDLRGYGPVERWPWVKTNTALLVWDPEREGEIRSGRQLFGGYTFEIFRRDGYAALAALDSDGDEVLTGSELDGIRAWFDNNSNGRSESGEVRDLDEFGIVGIAVRAITREGIHPTNPHGMQLRDGRTLPTWDWKVEPLKSPSS
jgi:hypothetical protein